MYFIDVQACMTVQYTHTCINELCRMYMYYDFNVHMHVHVHVG